MKGTFLGTNFFGNLFSFSQEHNFNYFKNMFNKLIQWHKRQTGSSINVDLSKEEDIKPSNEAFTH